MNNYEEYKPMYEIASWLKALRCAGANGTRCGTRRLRALQLRAKSRRHKMLQDRKIRNK